ncbi:unnamed protein product [Trichobilharzia regenti]|nr:unnamed protein product [Trichobilharzia regenti]
MLLQQPLLVRRTPLQRRLQPPLPPPPPNHEVHQ